MYITRDIEQQIRDFLDSNVNNILLFSGARQTGKTTIIENIKTSKPKLIINLWDKSEETEIICNSNSFSRFEMNLKIIYGFIPDNSQILIIDEAQASNYLGSFLMQMKSHWPNQKIILLGSILSNLIKENSPMPTGRVLEIICRPLNFREFLRFFNQEQFFELLPSTQNMYTETVDINTHNLLMREYELFMQLGGLPGIITSSKENTNLKIVLESLLSNIYKDADRFIGKKENKTELLQYGAILENSFKRIGELTCMPSTNSSILSTDSPAYRKILPKVLEAINNWHLAYTLHNETNGLSTKKGYSSKKYLFDTGILNYYINKFMPINFRSTQNEVLSKLLENIVLQELISKTGRIQNITSYKTNNKSPNELDFVLTTNNKVYPVEVKASSKTGKKSVSQLISYLQHNHYTNNGYVVYLGTPKKVIIDEKYEINYIPPYYLSLLFE